MLNRTKVLTVGLGLSAMAAALFSFTNGEDDEKKKKYHVIHQKDGELTTYDTILPMSSAYSVENFLADKGIDNEDVKIIKVPAMGHGMMFHGDGEKGEHRVMIKEFKHDIEIDGEEGDSKEVKIMMEIDDDGNKTIKKIVNGEEVEMTEEDLKKMEMHHGSHGEEMIIKMDMKDIEEHNMVIDLNEGEEVKIMVEMDDDGNKVVKKWVNGEEVELTDEELERIENHKLHGGHGNMMMFHMDDSDMTDEEKDEMMRKIKEEMSELHIEMNSLDGEIEIKIEQMMEQFDIDDEEGNVFIHKIEMDGDHHGAHKMRMHHGSDEDFTIVLVHENATEEELKAHETHMEVKREMISAEEDMMIFPNPNDGVFTVQFDQTEKLKTKIEITDAQGKVVFSDKLGKFSGTYKKEFDLKEYGAGMYIVNIQQGDDIKSHKIVVK